MKTTLTVGK